MGSFIWNEFNNKNILSGGNYFGDEGSKYLVEGLKSKSSLKKIVINCFQLFSSFLTLL